MNARSSILAILGVMLSVIGALMLTSAPALAAAPEAPETLKPESVTGSQALLRGFLNPGKEGGAGTFALSTYEFLFKASATECQGGSKTSEGMSLGGGREFVAQEITGLEPHTKYSVCLIARNGGEEAIGTQLTFITGPVEAPEAKPASEITASSAKLNGVLDPEHEGESGGEYYFQYWPSATECEHEEEVRGSTYHVAESVGYGEVGGQEKEAIDAVAKQLLPGTTYTFCLVVQQDGERATGPPVTFTTPNSAPGIGEETVSADGSGEATVAAQIAAGGLLSSYRVEYGTSTAYGSSTPEVSLGASKSPVAVHVRFGGLEPGTTYHFRFVAKNELGLAQGEDRSFETSGSAGTVGTALPDERVYELVSTSSGPGEVYAPVASDSLESDITSHQLTQAAANGEALVYMADPSDTTGNGNTGAGEGNDWLATRGSNSWTTSDITPVGSESGVEYEAFSSDLSTGIVETKTPQLTSDAPAECQNLYSRNSANGAYRSLITTSDDFQRCGNPHFVGASADESQIFFQDQAALTANAQEAELPEGGHNNTGGEQGEPCEFSCDLYERVDGQLRLINVLPKGEPAPNATFGGPAALGGGIPDGPDLSNAISSDGSRAFWTDTKAGPDKDHIYVFESGVGNVPVSGAGEAKYWTATPDGRYAFYTEGEKLWRFDTEHNTREEFLGKGLEGETAGVQGVVGINQTGEDGAYVYLVADAKLAPGAEKRICKSAQAERYEKEERGTVSQGERERLQREQSVEEQGQLPAGRGCDLYLLHGGQAKLIATLGFADDHISASFDSPQQFGDWVPSLGNRTAEVTPDGHDLVFESIRELTGYGNGYTNTEGQELEAYTYEADADRLSCVSCNPTGAPPIEPIFYGAGQRDGSLLPVTINDTYMHRWISEDGSHVFFETMQSLTPQDTNGALDVYEWDREGTASCPQTMPARRDDGCVFLLSGGESSDYSYLIDASASGNDVFFTSRAQLSAEDHDEKVDMYDARVDGYRPPSPPLCTGTGCQGVPPAPPTFATPSSVTFEGVGNFEPASKVAAKTKRKRSKGCKKGFVEKRGKCIKKVKTKKRTGRSGKRGKSGRKQ